MPVRNYTETQERKRARELSAVQVNRMGVHKGNRYGLLLECSCGTTWSKTPDESGELRRDFWVCPRRCNL